MVGKLTGEVVTKEELYEAAWATDCGLSMSKYAEAYQIKQNCLQRNFLSTLAQLLRGRDDAERNAGCGN